MKASIIIVNYNSGTVIKNCLNSIKMNTPFSHEIIIVDNNSRDNSRDLLKRLHYPNCRVIYNQQNYGYAESCNQGIHCAKGEFLITMNPDIIVTRNWISRLAWHLQNNPQTLVVAPKGLGIGGKQTVHMTDSNGSLIMLDREYSRLYLHQSEKVKYLIGCLLLFDRRLIKKIGYFDRELKLGADDFDLSLRVRKAGYQLRVAKDIVIKHLLHVSFNRSDPAECTRLNEASWQHFNSKWHAQLGEVSWEHLFEDQTPFFDGEYFT